MNKKEKNLPDGEKLVVFPPVCVGRRCCVIDIGFDDSFADWDRIRIIGAKASSRLLRRAAVL